MYFEKDSFGNERRNTEYTLRFVPNSLHFSNAFDAVLETYCSVCWNDMLLPFDHVGTYLLVQKRTIFASHVISFNVVSSGNL